MKQYKVILTDAFGHEAKAQFGENSAQDALETTRVVLSEAVLDPRGFLGVEPTFKGAKISHFMLEGEYWGLYVNVRSQFGSKVLAHETITIV